MLAVVFFYGGGAKLLDPQAFAVLIDSYGIVPDLLVMPAAIGLPLLEVIAAVGLVADIRGSLTAIGALLLIFMAILGYGIRISFHPLEKETSQWSKGWCGCSWGLD